MSSRRDVIYIDYESIKEFEAELDKDGLINFLEKKKIVISVDNDAYYYLMELKQHNNRLKNNIKRFN